MRRIASTSSSNVANYAGTKPSGQFTGYSPGAIGKLLLLAEAQHVNVRKFGGANLVAELKSTEGVRGAKRGEYQQNLVGTPSDEEFTSTTSQALAMLGLADSAKSSTQPDRAARHVPQEAAVRQRRLPDPAAREPEDRMPGGLGHRLHRIRRPGPVGQRKQGRGVEGRALPAQGAEPHTAASAPAAATPTPPRSRCRHWSPRGKPLGGAVGWLHTRQLGCPAKASERGAVNFQKGYDADSSLLATSQAGAALARAPLATIIEEGREVSLSQDPLLTLRRSPEGQPLGDQDGLGRGVGAAPGRAVMIRSAVCSGVAPSTSTMSVATSV